MSQFRSLLTQNVVTKILALVLAVLVWSFVELEVTSKETRPRVAIDIKLERKDAVVLGILDAEKRPIDAVAVELSGPRGVLADVPREPFTCEHFVPEDVTADIDPSRLIPITLTPSDLHLPSRVTAGIVPETVYVTVDRYVDVYVNIVAKKEEILPRAEMRDDLTYEVQSVIPPRIRIRAPSTLAARYIADGIPILPVSVRGLTQTTPFAVAFPDSLRQRGIQIGDQRATVTIRIEPRPEDFEVTVPVGKLLPEGGKYDFELKKPKEVKIKVRGPKNVIDRFKQQPTPPIQVYVDLQNYKVAPGLEGGTIPDAPMRWILLPNQEQYPGLQVLGVPEQADAVEVRKKE